MNNELGTKLRQYRLNSLPENRNSLRRVAKDLDIDFSLLSRIETGDQKPSDKTLHKMISVYQISPKDAFFLFSLLHATEQFREAAKRAKEDAPRGYQNLFSQAFFRTTKNKNTN